MCFPYPDTSWGCHICRPSQTPMAPPQLIGIYGSPMGRVWDMYYVWNIAMFASWRPDEMSPPLPGPFLGVVRPASGMLRVCFDTSTLGKSPMFSSTGGGSIPTLSIHHCLVEENHRTQGGSGRQGPREFLGVYGYIYIYIYQDPPTGHQWFDLRQGPTTLN